MARDPQKMRSQTLPNANADVLAVMCTSPPCPCQQQQHTPIRQRREYCLQSARKGRQKKNRKKKQPMCTYVLFLGPGGVLLYGALRQNSVQTRPGGHFALRGYESTPLATGTSMAAILASGARPWNSLELLKGRRGEKKSDVSK
jgi:hypothetical protein